MINILKNNKEKIFKEIFYTCLAILLAIMFRSFLFEPYVVPSGSMKPNLLVGDYIFVSKFSYGYSNHSFPFSPNIFKGRIFFSKPERGDIVVFKKPTDISQNYVKRLIAIPGDKFEMIEGKIFVNDIQFSYIQTKDFIEQNIRSRQLIETNNRGKSYNILKLTDDDNYGPIIIPEKMYFFLGDNRDNSVDSRFSKVGFVPEENLVGKAKIIFYSTDSSFWPIWDWILKIRFERLFNLLK